MSLFLAVIFGIGFGYILYRVGALEYKNILNALRLKDLAIPKFMLLSVAVTSVGIFSLRLKGLVTLDLITTNPVGNIVGGLIFGVGFALTGYCPGTSIAAMGEGKKDAKYAVLGGMAGVFVYSFIQQYTGFSISAYDIGKLSLVNLTNFNPFSVSVIYSSVLIMIIYIIDYWEQKKSNISYGGTMNYVEK
jgi:uncharacterized protein